VNKVVYYTVQTQAHNADEYAVNESLGKRMLEIELSVESKHFARCKRWNCIHQYITQTQRRFMQRLITLDCITFITLTIIHGGT